MVEICDRSSVTLPQASEPPGIFPQATTCWPIEPDDYWRLNRSVYVERSCDANGAPLRFKKTNMIVLMAGLATLFVAAQALAEIKPVPLVQQTLSGLGFDAGKPDGIWARSRSLP